MDAAADRRNEKMNDVVCSSDAVFTVFPGGL